MADKFYPDEKEPHIHIYKNGATFTDARHRHTDLEHGNRVRTSACEKVIHDLTSGTPNTREEDLAAYIQREFLDKG